MQRAQSIVQCHAFALQGRVADTAVLWIVRTEALLRWRLSSCERARAVWWCCGGVCERPLPAQRPNTRGAEGTERRGPSGAPPAAAPAEEPAEPEPDREEGPGGRAARQPRVASVAPLPGTPVRGSWVAVGSRGSRGIAQEAPGGLGRGGHG